MHSCSLPTARYFLFIFRLTQTGSVLSGYTVLLPAGCPPLLPPPFLLASISLFSVRLVFRLPPLGPGVNQYGHTGLLFHPMGSFFHYTLHSRWYPFFPSAWPLLNNSTFWCAPLVNLNSLRFASIVGPLLIYLFLSYACSQPGHTVRLAIWKAPSVTCRFCLELSPRLASSFPLPSHRNGASCLAHSCSICLFSFLIAFAPPLPSILGANAMASRHCMTAGFMG